MSFHCHYNKAAFSERLLPYLAVVASKNNSLMQREGLQHILILTFPNK